MAQEERRAGLSGRAALVLLAVLSAAALGLRLATLARRGLWLDEAAEATFAALSLGDCVFADPNIPPLNRTILYFWTRLFGNSEFSLRLPAAVFGTLCVPAIYMLGARTFGRGVGLVAALLVTFAPPAIEFSQEARQYAPLVLLTILATHVFLRCVDRPRASSFALYGLLAAIGMYTFYLFALVILGHLVWYLFLGTKSRARVVGVVITCLLVLAAYLPWVPQFFEAVERQERGWVVYPLFQVYHLFHIFGPGMSAYDVRWLGSEGSLAGEPRADRDVVLSSLVSNSAHDRVALILAFYLLREIVLLFGYVIPFLSGLRLAAGCGKGAAYFTIAFALPVVLLAALFWWVPALYPRYLMFLFPFFIILLSLFLCRPGPRVWRVSAVACMAVLLLVSLGTYYFSRTYGKEDYRSAVAYLNKVTDADDVVVCCPGYIDAAVGYYYRGESEVIRCDSEGEAVTLARSLAGRPAPAGHDPRVWVVMRNTIPSEVDVHRVDGAFGGRFRYSAHRYFEAGWGLNIYGYGNAQFNHDSFTDSEWTDGG